MRRLPPRSWETAYWLKLLVVSGIVSASQLAAVRNECDQLIAIFVTILRRAKKQ
jgi:hypothetical protein